MSGNAHQRRVRQTVEEAALERARNAEATCVLLERRLADEREARAAVERELDAERSARALAQEGAAGAAAMARAATERAALAEASVEDLRRILAAEKEDHAAKMAEAEEEIRDLHAEDRDVAKLRRRLAAAHAERDEANRRARAWQAEAESLAGPMAGQLRADDAAAALDRALRGAR